MTQTKFTIVTPVYNAAPYVEAAIKSVLSQKYDGVYQIVVVDDCSTDGTTEKIRSIQDGRLIKIFNNVRVGALANIYHTIKNYAEDDSVIVTVDGDDLLAHDGVLARLNEAYRGGAAITYGNFIPLSRSYPKYCQQIPDVMTYRRSNQWLASHLRTFKKRLWDRINPADMQDSSGKFYSVAWDASFMYPMLEMAGNQRAIFIDDVLYEYNDLNPINDMKINQQLQIKTAEAIKAKPLYQMVVGDI